MAFWTSGRHSSMDFGGEIGVDDLAHLQVVGAVVLDELLALVVADEFVQLVVQTH